MGQLKFVDEDDFPNLEFTKFCLNEFVDLQNKISQLRDIMYPDIRIWCDCGTTVDVNRIFLDKAISDANRYKWKRRLFKKRNK